MASYDERPMIPLHINCRCVYVPVMQERKNVQAYRQQNWQEWFEELDEDDKEEILGYTRYSLYNEGKVSLSEMLKGKYNDKKNLDEIRSDLKKKNIIF